MSTWDPGSTGEEIFADVVVRVTLEPDGVIVFRRLPGRYDLKIDFPRMVHGVMDAVAANAQRARGVIIDVREGTGRHEPEFEALAGEFNKFLADTFGKVAWLVTTGVGVLQAGRFARALGITLRAFTDEDEARRWLLE